MNNPIVVPTRTNPAPQQGACIIHGALSPSGSVGECVLRRTLFSSKLCQLWNSSHKAMVELRRTSARWKSLHQPALQVNYGVYHKNTHEIFVN